MNHVTRLSRRRFLGTSVLAAGCNVARHSRVAGHPRIPSHRSIAICDAVTGDGKSLTLKRAEVQELGKSLRGNLILPGHPAYDPARRVWNAQMNKRPAFIVQPRGAADVKNAIQFARASNVLVAVKCGGHSPSGKSTCERGMLLDLSLLRGVQVDPAAKIAHVAGGSLLGDLDHEAMARVSSRPRARSLTRASAGSRSAAASAASRGASGSRWTTCARSKSSRVKARSCGERAGESRAVLGHARRWRQLRRRHRRSTSICIRCSDR